MKDGTSPGILSLIPHRYPFVMIDRITELEPGRRVLAYKNVSRGDPLCTGPSGGRRILPRPLVIESVGQSAYVLVTAGRRLEGFVPFFVGCDGRFTGDVEAGCQLMVEAWIEKAVSRAAIVRGRACVAGRQVADLTLSAALLQLGDSSPERRDE